VTSLINLEIVSMQEENLDEVLAIETLSFPYPWKRNQFEEELLFAHSYNLLAMVDLHGKKKVAGYICCWIVADEIHILNLASHPDFRRQGVATILFHSLFNSVLRGKKITLVTLEVRRFNTSALQLYKKLGFVVKGIRKGYYPEGEDAVVMELELSEKTS
jgi:ribosomal-protein-alanine N-acetyltransferase